jgi:hypothetical protein
MTVKPAQPGTGFDLNQPLTASMAAQFKSAGNAFAIRYIPRTAALVKGNLTAGEIEIILGAGLNLMAVQHCALPGWEPNAALGGQYGQYAATYSQSIGLPAGMNIWLDLEGVGPLVKAEDVIAYCEAWFTAVSAAGYIAGLYIGFGSGLTPKELYDLKGVEHYWSAYNYTDGLPTRGFQIKQHDQQSLNGIQYDPNTLQADQLGGLPVWLSPS